MGNMVAAALAAMVVGTPVAQAQRPSDALAAQWRTARAAELDAEMAALRKERAALATATPPATPPATTDAVEPAAPPKDATTDTSGDADVKASAARRKFGELDLGVGLSSTLDRGKRDRIGDAFLDENKIVRVSDQNNVRARVMLEAHYFFTPCGTFLGHYNACVAPETLARSGDKEDVTDKELGNDLAEQAIDPRRHRVPVPKRALWGLGPFIAIEGGGDSIINAIGAGLMIGFRKSVESTQSFNFGIGYVVDPNTRVLGDGVRENQPLPAGETQVRFKETAQGGLLAIASFSF